MGSCKSCTSSFAELPNPLSDQVPLSGLPKKEVQEIAQRIRQLEAERKGLEQLVRRLENTSDTEAAITQIAKASEAYFQEFDRKFDTLPISKRKALLQKIVERIDIDRETRIAKCYLRKLPKDIGHPALDILRTPVLRVPPTRFELVLQA